MCVLAVAWYVSFRIQPERGLLITVDVRGPVHLAGTSTVDSSAWVQGGPAHTALRAAADGSICVRDPIM